MFTRTPSRGLLFLLKVGKLHLKGIIYGERIAQIAQTAIWFWSLKHSAEEPSVLELRGHNRFDFAFFETWQLRQIVDSNPQRALEINTGYWRFQQCTALVSGLHHLQLKLGDNFGMRSHGAKLVNALKKRISSSVSLSVQFADSRMLPFDDKQLHRLFQLRVFDKLSFSELPKDCVMLPFAGLKRKWTDSPSHDTQKVARNEVG